MTQSTQVPSTTVVLTGSDVGPWATVWTYGDAAEVTVWLSLPGEADEQVDSGDVTVTGATPLVNGGNVQIAGDLVPADGWATGSRVYLVRATPRTQTANLGDSSKINLAALEKALDRNVRQLQDLAVDVARSIKTEFNTSPMAVLPSAEDRANKVVEFSDEGQPRADRSLDEVVNLALSRVVAQFTLTADDMASPAALQAVVTASPGLHPIVPRGTWPLGFMAFPTEIDISGLAGITFAPGAEIVSDNPVRGLMRALSNTGLRVEGFRGRWEFDGGDILRPDFAWDVDSEEMFDWIDSWNAAFGTSISTALNGQTFGQRWNVVYTGAARVLSWNQISGAGRASGLLLNGCKEVKLYDPFINNCVAQINDQGGLVSGDGLNNYATYIDRLKMGDDQRFAYLFKRAVATYIEHVFCNVNGTRDNGGAPHIVYGSGNPLATPTPDSTVALEIGSCQITDWGIAPAIKIREASVNIGSIIGHRTQSLLGLVHCTGSIGPITSVDQALARDADGTTITASTGSRFVANFTDCYDMALAAMSVQQRASTVPLTQDGLRVADLDGCDNMRFEGFNVSCTRRSDEGGMVRLALTTNSYFGPSSLTNLGPTTVALYEMPVNGDVGGTNSGNSFAPVTCSTLATVAKVSGSSKKNSFTVDPRLLTDGYVEGTTVADTSFGASNNIILTTGERVVPLSAAPSFETKANALFVMSRTDDAAIDSPTDLNFTDGRAVSIDGRAYTARTTLTGSGNEFKIATDDEGGVSASIKRLRAAMNNELLSGAGAGVIYNNGGTAHATYFGVSSGRTLAAVNRVPGAAGNGAVMSTTETNGAWVSGLSAGGGLLDSALIGATLAITSGASTIAVSVPVAPPKGSELTVVKDDSGAGTVAALGLATLSRQTDRIRAVYDGTAWRLPKLMAPASTTSVASLNVPHGTAPTSPVNGDIWTTAAGAFYRQNGVTVTVGGLENANTWTARQTVSAAGAASAPALLLSGLPYSAGSTTTNHPLLYLNSTGATPTTWASGGTAMGVNLPAGSTSHFLDFRKNGSVALFSVDSNGRMMTQKGVTFSNSINYAGASDVTNSWYYLKNNLVGSPSRGVDDFMSPHYIMASNSTTPGTDTFDLFHTQNVLETGWNGIQVSMNCKTVVNGIPSAYGLFAVGMVGSTRVKVNMRGTGATYFDYLGGGFGGNWLAINDAGGTFIRSITGAEFDVANAGSSAKKIGVSIVLYYGDTTRGVYDDAGLCFDKAETVTNSFKNIIQIGTYDHAAPVGADSTLFCGVVPGIGPDIGVRPIALHGIDLTSFDFQSGGSAFKSTGFQVNPSGNVTTPVVTLTGGVTMRAGAGSPEGVVTAVVGSTYYRTNGGAGTSQYVKESGSGNTGWVAK